MKNHNVEAISNPRAARIAPQEEMPGAMRVLYPETTPVQNFQAKVWVGGDSIDDAEYEDGKVKAVVAYLRSVDNQLEYKVLDDPDRGKPLNATYQLQQWRCLDATTPFDYNEKWQLKPVDSNTAWKTHHLRKPRPHIINDSFTFYIDTDKFASLPPPEQYRYKVISFEKLETKLHLVSKVEVPGYSPYEHIEDNIDVEAIFTNMDLATDSGYDDCPIVAEGTFSPGDTDPTISISSMWYYDPEVAPPQPSGTEITHMTDFVICIKPESKWY